jgi:hypothetical protein
MACIQTTHRDHARDKRPRKVNNQHHTRRT